ncbi:hypothetical protein [Streptomyces sp. WM6372]|uniref:hypothetical protein n=1 Tax=Streptomyces sp. WM6372 TaxID=1415555 RepID=UPI003B634742
MKPKPFSALNRFTVPVAMSRPPVDDHLSRHSEGGGDRPGPCGTAQQIAHTKGQAKGDAREAKEKVKDTFKR